MRKLLLLLVLIISSHTIIFAQLWTVRYNGTGNGEDVLKAMVVDNAGNVYVTGSTYTGPGNYDYLTIKYNSSGALLWQVKYNGPPGGTDQANAIFVDNNGNVYVTGSSYQLPFTTNQDIATVKYNAQGVQQWVARFDGIRQRADNGTAIKADASGNVYVTGWTTDMHGSYARKDYITIKYNPAGVQQWAVQYNGLGNKDDVPAGIGLDGLGNVYVAGTSYAGSVGVNDLLTVKYNSLGVQQWEKRYDGAAGGYDYAGGMTVDNAGNVYVTGASYETINQDYVTLKYNTGGTQLWKKTYNGPGNGYDIAHAIAVDNSGNVYVTGESQSAEYKTDYRTIKYNPSGVQQWTTSYDGTAKDNDGANTIAVDGGGNVYITGYINGIIDNWNIASVKYSAAGARQWVKTYDGPGHKSDVGIAIGVDLNGNVYVGGTSAGSSSGSDFVMIKYGPSTTGSIAAAKQVENPQGSAPGKFMLKNYPNPFKTSTKIQFSIPADGQVKLVIYDNLGKQLSTPVNGKLKAGSYEVQWEPGNLPAGNYFYRLSSGKFEDIVRMILMK